MAYNLEHIIAENIKCLRLVSIDLGNKSTAITGPNGSGKTSLLDAVRWCLSGRGNVIAEGAARCRVELTLRNGEQQILAVVRSQTADGKPRVEVTLAGEKQSSPQKLLDGLFSELTFTPLGFDALCVTAAGRREQANILRQIAGLDTTDIESERKQVFDSRSLVNRQVEQAEARLKAFPPIRPDTPAEEISVVELSDELQRIERNNANIRSLADAQKADEAIITRLFDSRDRALTEIERQKREIGKLDTEIEAKRANVRRAEEQLQKLVEQNPAPVQQKIQEAGQINASVRRHQEKQRLEREWMSQKLEADALTAKIAELDEQKAQTIREAKFPVPGLSVEEDGVRFEGRPYENWNHAARARISTAIACHQNAGLNLVLMDDAAGIGPDVQAAIVSEAEAAGKIVIFCVYQESAGTAGIHIELGRVVAVDGKEAQG